MSACAFSDVPALRRSVRRSAVRGSARRAGRRRTGCDRNGPRARRGLRARSAADPVGQLLLVPRPRRRNAAARSAARRPGGAFRGPGPPGRAGRGGRERSREQPLRAAGDRERPTADAAQRRPLDRRAGRDPAALDRSGGGVGVALGVHSARASRAPAGLRPGMGPQPDRQLRPGPSGRRGSGTVGGGRPRDAAAAGDAGPDRSAADPGRAGGVPQRRFAGRLRAGGGPAAGLPALRRANGVRVAGRGPVRGHQRLSDRRRAVDVALARLGDRRLQREHAVRPFHHRAARGRHAARRDARSAHRHRLQPQPQSERRRRHRRRRVHGRIRGRSRGDHVDGLARVDAGLRPLPRPQVRPALAEGVLRGPGQFQQYSGAWQGVQVRQLAAADHRPDRGAGGGARRARREAARGPRGVHRPGSGGCRGAVALGGVARPGRTRRLGAA